MPAKNAALSPPTQTLTPPLQEQLDRIEELLTSLHYIVDVQVENTKELRNQVRLLLNGARIH